MSSGGLMVVNDPEAHNDSLFLFSKPYFSISFDVVCRISRNKRPVRDKHPLQRGEYTKPVGFDG